MMLDTVKHLNNLDIQGIKIHMLNICKDTPIETLYNKEHFHILTKEEYIDIVIKQLELLGEEIVIHRITSDPDKDSLIEPTWLLKKFCLLNDIDKEMKKEILTKVNTPNKRLHSKSFIHNILLFLLNLFLVSS